MKTRTERKAVDWDLIRQRLAAVERALEDEFSPSAGRRREVLAARAAALAATEHDAPQTGPELELLEFELGGERYAIDMRYVQEVRALGELTPLPGTPAFVRGIVNLRGAIMAVVDLKKLLALRDQDRPDDPGRLILLSNGDMTFCVLTDRITGACRVPLAAIRPLAPDGARMDLVAGMAAGNMVVLDGSVLLSDRMIAMD